MCCNKSATSGKKDQQQKSSYAKHDPHLSIESDACRRQRRVCGRMESLHGSVAKTGTAGQTTYFVYKLKSHSQRHRCYWVRKKNQITDHPSSCALQAHPNDTSSLPKSLDGGDILVCQASMVHVVVQRRLHGHSDRIESLSWQPPPGIASSAQRVYEVQKLKACCPNNAMYTFANIIRDTNPRLHSFSFWIGGSNCQGMGCREGI